MKRQRDDGARRIILVDMDDTISDFTGHALALLKQRHPTVTLPDANATTFPLANSFESADDRNALTALYLEQGFFRDMPPIDGAVEALHTMVDAGYNVRLCSSPLKKSPACAAEKVEWVSRWLGQDWVDRLILTKDKTLVIGDILIDDAPVAKGESLKPTWMHVYFAQPHNAPGRPGADASRTRLERWSAWPQVISKVLSGDYDASTTANQTSKPRSSKN